MKDGRLTIWINGREALPVRAIPFVTGWKRFTPDVLALNLARYKDEFGTARASTLTAYHLSGNTPVPVKPREWNAVVTKIKGFEAKLIKMYPDEYDIRYDAWRHEAVEHLPSNVFVWLDEFEKEYQADRRRNQFVDERPDDAELILAPILESDTRVRVLMGFDVSTSVIEQKQDAATVAIEQAKLDAKIKSNKKIWDDTNLKTLWKESCLPGVTQADLAKKYGVTPQRISALLAKAKNTTSKPIVDPFSIAASLQFKKSKTKNR